MADQQAAMETEREYTKKGGGLRVFRHPVLPCSRGYKLVGRWVINADRTFSLSFMRFHLVQPSHTILISENGFRPFGTLKTQKSAPYVE